MIPNKMSKLDQKQKLGIIQAKEELAIKEKLKKEDR